MRRWGEILRRTTEALDGATGARFHERWHEFCRMDDVCIRRRTVELHSETPRQQLRHPPLTPVCGGGDWGARGGRWGEAGEEVAGEEKAVG